MNTNILSEKSLIIQRIFAAFYKNPPFDIKEVHTVHNERFVWEKCCLISQFLKIPFMTMLKCSTSVSFDFCCLKNRSLSDKVETYCHGLVTQGDG